MVFIGTLVENYILVISSLFVLGHMGHTWRSSGTIPGFALINKQSLEVLGGGGIQNALTSDISWTNINALTSSQPLF